MPQVSPVGIIEHLLGRPARTSASLARAGRPGNVLHRLLRLVRRAARAGQPGRAGPVASTTATAAAQCSTIEITTGPTSPVAAGRIGRKTADVFRDAWRSVTISRLPAVLLKTHVNSTALATVSTRYSQNE